MAHQHTHSLFDGPGPDEYFRKRLAIGVFEVQCCLACAKHQFYPRTLCRYCGSANLQWVQAAGSAVVYATTVVRRKIELGGDYNVAIVELKEGPRMMSCVEGMAPHLVRIGQCVRASIKRRGDEAVLVFVSAEQQASYG